VWLSYTFQFWKCLWIFVVHFDLDSLGTVCCLPTNEPYVNCYLWKQQMCWIQDWLSPLRSDRSGGGGVLPYMGYIGMCGPKQNGFSAVLVINKVFVLVILAILVINKAWFLHSDSLELFGIFRRRSYITNALLNLWLRQLCQPQRS